jgi:hypothetical protein
MQGDQVPAAVRRHPQRDLTLRALLALALLTLVGLPVPALADPEDCPDIGLVPELTRLTKFRPGEGRTLDDVRYDVFVRSVSDPVCSEKDRKVRVGLRLEFATQRGRLERSNRVEFSYFVAIRHRVSGAILTKEVFPVAFDLPQGRDGVVIEEELEQVTIPIKKGEQGRYYAILIGLQLTEDELTYNRQRRGEAAEPRPPGGPPAGQRPLPTLPALPGAPKPAQ